MQITHPALGHVPGGILATALLFAITGNAYAQQAPPHPTFDATLAAQATTSPSTVTLASLLQAALESNPEIKAANARVAAAAQRPVQAASLPDPTVTLVMRNVDFPDLTLGDQMMSLAGFRFTQPLPAGGKRPQRREVAKRGIDVARSRVEAIRRRVIQELTTAYYQLAFVHQSIAIVRDTQRLLTDLEATAEARYAVGDGIQQDVLKAQVEISVLLDRLVQLEQQRDSAETRINRLIGRPSTTPIGIPESIPVPDLKADLESLRSEALQVSAVLAERNQRIHQQEASVELARRDRRPDFVVSGAWFSRGTLPSIWEMNVGITLPIRKSQRQDRAIDQALEELNARRHDRGNTVAAVDEVVRDSFLRLDRARRLIRLFGDGIIPQAVLSLESATAGYSVAKVDFLTVLDNVVTLLTFRLELEQEKTNAMQALARIEEHLGRSLGATPASVWTSPERQTQPAAGLAPGTVAATPAVSAGPARVRALGAEDKTGGLR